MTADVQAGRNLVIRLEVPGMDREHLKVLTVAGQCIVCGERPPTTLESDLRPLGFELRFALPPRADTEKLSANCSDGVLELRIPVADK